MPGEKEEQWLFDFTPDERVHADSEPEKEKDLFDYETEDDALSALISPSASDEKTEEEVDQDRHSAEEWKEEELEAELEEAALEQEQQSSTYAEQDASSFSSSSSCECETLSSGSVSCTGVSGGSDSPLSSSFSQVASEDGGGPFQDGQETWNSSDSDEAMTQQEPSSVGSCLPKRKGEIFTPSFLRQAALGFLASLKPSAAALKVSLGTGCTADAAAFWLLPKQRLCSGIERTAVALVCSDSARFHGDARRREELRRALQSLQEEKLVLEAEIREKEPCLRNDSLFEEESEWDYSASANRRYRNLLKKMEKTHFSLLHESRFDRMIAEGLANAYYLIVPEDRAMEDEGEYPPGWGVVLACADFSIRQLREATVFESLPENRLNLALKTAQAASSDTLFSRGVSLSPEGIPQFHVPPKRRRPLRS